MKPWLRYTICIIVGLGAGSAFAISQIRGGMADGTIRNGAWTTAKSYGSADAGALIRAKVALTGILALPAKEAMYFSAKNDSEGKPLDGSCTYEVKGNTLPGRWWSVTLYKGKGWLVKNSANRWSIPASAVTPGADGSWSFAVSPDAQKTGAWLPTGGVKAFDLTLRLYHPSAATMAAPDKAALPTIVRKGCK